MKNEYNEFQKLCSVMFEYIIAKLKQGRIENNVLKYKLQRISKTYHNNNISTIKLIYICENTFLALIIDLEKGGRYIRKTGMLVNSDYTERYLIRYLDNIEIKNFRNIMYEDDNGFDKEFLESLSNEINV